MSLDPVVAERLVRLRTLLAGALAAATDETSTGRHVSVIFLDGVAELALHLAADEVGFNVTPRHGLEDIVAGVAGVLGPAWNKKSWKGVRELHRARNLVQHHSILPDRQHVPLWTADLDRFVHSLIAAAFGADLTTVRAADAVDDHDLRTQLTQSEAANDAGQFAAAVQLAKAALDQALQRFRTVLGTDSPSRFPFNTFDEFHKIDGALKALEQFVDVAYLATDPADWLWLERTEGLSRTQELEKADAERALSFTLGWILRFEAFESRLPKEKVVERVEPRLNASYRPPAIVAVNVHDEQRFGKVVMDVTLSEVPPTWLDYLHQALGQGQDAGDVPTDTWVDLDGSTVGLEIPDTVDGAEIPSLVDKLIARTHALFESRLQAQRDRRDSQLEAAETFREGLPADARVKRVTADHWSNGQVLIRLEMDDPVATSLNDHELSDALRRCVPEGANWTMGFSQGVMTIAEGQCPPSEAMRIFDVAVVDASQRAADARAEREAGDARHQRVVTSARAAFAELHSQRSGGR